MNSKATPSTNNGLDGDSSIRKALPRLRLIVGESVQVTSISILFYLELTDYFSTLSVYLEVRFGSVRRFVKAESEVCTLVNLKSGNTVTSLLIRVPTATKISCEVEIDAIWTPCRSSL